MSDSIESNVSDLKMAYHLLLRTRALEARHRGDKTGEKKALAELEKDGVDISDTAKAARADQVSRSNGGDKHNTNISLSALIKRLHELNLQGGGSQLQTQVTAQMVSYEETIEMEASISYRELEKVDGLVKKNRNLAETDRYQFEFSNGSTLKITDKWTNRSTTIWGDPHIDTSDEAGANDGDFKDLTGSDQYTTFMLMDGTRLTITARDNGIIEKVDIFKGSQHLSGIGAGYKIFDEESGLFAGKVETNGSSALSLVPTGDTVYAGGDGNDWFDASKNLIWGTTTGPIVTSRPSSVIEYTYSQKVTQKLSFLQVNQTA